MRLSITLDDDLYAVAKAVAKAEESSLSAAINRLLRRAVEGPPDVDQRPRQVMSTFPTSAGARTITEEDVKSVEDT
jgi:Arc/MetJ family transcription regulator